MQLGELLELRGRRIHRRGRRRSWRRRRGRGLLLGVGGLLLGIGGLLVVGGLLSLLLLVGLRLGLLLISLFLVVADGTRGASHDGCRGRRADQRPASSHHHRSSSPSRCLIRSCRRPFTRASLRQVRPPSPRPP